MARSRKRGTEFEQLAKDLFELLSINDKYTTVEGPKVFLDGKDGKREFDVVIRAVVADLNILTVVECRDWNKKIDMTHLDGFVSKMADVNANKGVIVSRKGFSKNAIKKAKRLGIVLCIAKDAFQNSEFKNVGLDCPVVVSVVESVSVQVVDLHILVKAGAESVILSHDAFSNLNGIPLAERLSDALISSEIEAETLIEPQEWRPFPEGSAVCINDVNGAKVRLESTPFFRLSSLIVSHYFGYLSDFPSSQSLETVTKDSATIFFQFEDFWKDETHKEVLSKFSSFKDIPSVHPFRLRTIVTPDAFEVIEHEVKRRFAD